MKEYSRIESLPWHSVSMPKTEPKNKIRKIFLMERTINRCQLLDNIDIGTVRKEHGTITTMLNQIKENILVTSEKVGSHGRELENPDF